MHVSPHTCTVQVNYEVNQASVSKFKSHVTPYYNRLSPDKAKLNKYITQIAYEWKARRFTSATEDIVVS